MRIEDTSCHEPRVRRRQLLLADIDERKRTEALLNGEKRLLEMVASGRPLEDVLEATCSLVEAIVGNSTCSILLIDCHAVLASRRTC